MRWSSTALSAPKLETTAIRPARPSPVTARSMSSASTPAKRAFSCATSAAVKRGAMSITSRRRSASAMTRFPNRHGIVGGVLIDVRIAVERGFRLGRVDRRIGGEAVEPAAAHEPQQVEQDVAGRLDLAVIARLAQNARRGEAAAIAELGKVDLDQAHAVKRGDQQADVVARLDPNRVGVRLAEERLEAD